jgi:hypothetical protein
MRSELTLLVDKEGSWRERPPVRGVIQLLVTLALKPKTQTVEMLINDSFQEHRLASADVATSSRRARGCGLRVVAFRDRGHDPRHSARPVNLHSAMYASRFYRARRSCTHVAVQTTSTADFRTTRTARTRWCSRPDRSRGAARPGRTRRSAWSTWRHGAGWAHRRSRRDGPGWPRRRQGRLGIARVDRQRRTTGVGRGDWTHRSQRRDRLHWSSWSNRAQRRPGPDGLYRIHRVNRQRRDPRTRGTHRAYRCHRLQRSCGPQRRHWCYGCQRICGTPWRCGRDGLRGTNRAAGYRRI